MKKPLIFAICLSFGLAAFGQDDEKQEAIPEATVSPVVVHEEVQKKIPVEALTSKVQADAAKPVLETTARTNQSKSESTQLDPVLILMGVAVLAYFLFVWFLSYASRTPAIAMSITRGLYYIIGLPVVLTLLGFRLLKSALDIQHSNYQSGLEEIRRPSGENSGSYNNSIADRNNHRDQHSNNSESRQSVKNQKDSSNGERIVIQVNLNDRWYNRVTMTTGSSSGQISKKLQEVAHGERNKKDFHGRVRAIGEQSQRVYDIIS